MCYVVTIVLTIYVVPFCFSLFSVLSFRIHSGKVRSSSVQQLWPTGSTELQHGSQPSHAGQKVSQDFTIQNKCLVCLKAHLIPVHLSQCPSCNVIFVKILPNSEPIICGSFLALIVAVSHCVIIQRRVILKYCM